MMNKNANAIYNIDILEKERRRQFLTFKDLAEKAGENYHPVYRLLTSKRKAKCFRNPGMVKSLAEALGLDPEQVRR